MSVKLIVVALLATATIANAQPEPAVARKVLTVKSQCAQEEQECKSCITEKKYPAGECVQNGEKFWRLDKCETSEGATVTSFSSEDDCQGRNTKDVPKACTAERYIKAVCEEGKVKLLRDCPAGCNKEECQEIAFDDDSQNCQRYGEMDLYFKPESVSCSTEEPVTANVKFSLFTEEGCTGTAASPTELELALSTDSCTAFIHKKAACDTTATIQECYGSGGGEGHCTTCTTSKTFNFNEYIDYNDKYYYIDQCPTSGDGVTFKVFDKEKKPEEKKIAPTCTGTTPNEYTIGVCGDETPTPPDPKDPPVPQQPHLTVVTGCSENQCSDKGCTTKKYELEKCVQEGAEHYKATCGEKPSLQKYASAEDCQNNASPTPVSLPKSETCQVGSDSKYEQVTCPKMPGDGGSGTPYTGPVIIVKKSCTDDQCTQCAEQETVGYNADGECHKKQSPSADGTGPGTTTSYKADCATLKVTTFTDATCQEGSEVVELPKTCTTGSIASCTTPGGDSDSTAKSDTETSSETGKETGSETSSEASKESKESSDEENGSGTTGNTTSNDSGIDAAPAAHSVGAAVAAFGLLVVVMMC